jgi:hypothetical protein
MNSFNDLYFSFSLTPGVGREPTPDESKERLFFYFFTIFLTIFSLAVNTFKI